MDNIDLLKNRIEMIIETFGNQALVTHMRRQERERFCNKLEDRKSHGRCTDLLIYF